MPSILFTSNHSYLDFASGAALAMRDLLTSLVKRGWEARVVCGSVLDTYGNTTEQIVKSRGVPIQSRQHDDGTRKYSIYELREAGVDITIYAPAQWSNPVTLEEGYPFVQLLDAQLQKNRPDIIVDFGGSWLGRGMLAVAKRHGIPVVFWLRNTEYFSRDLFSMVSGAIVPSQFAAQHYQKKFGFACQVIPSLVLPQRVLCEQRQPKYLTYIAPTPNKGVFYFARIASELGRLRPDIPMLVVLGRGNPVWLQKTGLNLAGLPNLKVMPATNDPREYYRVTRAIVAPVLWEETFLRTAVESMFNGIPLLASRRGGVPDTMGPCGFVFDIPERHTPKSHTVPTVAEVRPWIDVIQQLFDEPQFEAEQRRKCLDAAQRFNPRRVIDAHERYLQHVITLRGSKIPRSSQSLPADLAFLQRFFPQPMNLERFNTGTIRTV